MPELCLYPVILQFQYDRIKSESVPVIYLHFNIEFNLPLQNEFQ